MPLPHLQTAPSRPHRSSPPLVLVGASTRAAAWSAIRAGWRPLCADLFADQDLLDVATAIAVEEYPTGLIDAVSTLTANLPNETCPRIYTGAMENHPDVLNSLAAGGPLLGNSTDVLKLVRDPHWVARVCQAASLSCPEVRNGHDIPEANGQWMLRRLDSAGGAGVSEWKASTGSPGRNVVFQRRIPGLAASAVCLGNGSSASVLGITEQLVGEPWLHAPRWSWCGSIGPLALPASLNEQVAQLADVLASASGLVGLFGIDLVLDNKSAWPIEINPRYTGSAEVIEMASGRSMIGRHLEAFGEPPVAPLDAVAPLGDQTTATIHGKAVLYAPRATLVSGLPEGGTSWRLADVPQPGHLVDQGRPVCTILATATSLEGCRNVLERASENVYQKLASIE